MSDRCEHEGRLVIGIGNPFRRDDGIGPVVAARVERLAPHLPVIQLDGEATRMVEAWSGRDRVVVVDAVRNGAPPGTVHRVEVGRDSMPGWSAGPSSHAAGLAEAVALGQALERLPATLIVLGVEPAELHDGPGLSPAVEAVVAEVTALVVAEAMAIGCAARGQGVAPCA